MSRYSNFIGYVPDKLRLETSGVGDLLPDVLGNPPSFIGALAIGPISTSSGVKDPGLTLGAAGTNTLTIASGCTYIDFKNIVATPASNIPADIISITASGLSSSPLDIVFSNLSFAGYGIVASGSRFRKFSFSSLETARNITFSGANDFASELYFPNLKTITLNIFTGGSFTYGSGGFINIDQSFPALQYVANAFAVLGHSGFSSGTSQILPANHDFLSSAVYITSLIFQAPSNYTNIAIAQNLTGISGSLSSANSISISCHQNTTGVLLPPCTNIVGPNYSVAGAIGQTGNLTINTITGYHATGFYRTTLTCSYNGVSTGVLTINNNNIRQLFKGTSGPALSLTSSGNIIFSGNDLLYFGLSSAGAPLSVSAFNDITFTTTGQTLQTNSGTVNSNSNLSFASTSGNITVSLPNATNTVGNFILSASGINKTILLDLPEVTGNLPLNPDPVLGTGAYVNGDATNGRRLFVGGTGSTGIINQPKCHIHSGGITVSGISGTTITITGADLTYFAGFTGYTSGTINYTFTGGPGSGSGIVTGAIDNRTFLSGSSVSGDFGTLSSGRAITISLSGTPSTGILNATGLHQLSGTTTLQGLSGSVITLNAADLTHLSGGVTAYTSGTINYTFTGGPGSGSGIITSTIDQRTFLSGSSVSGNFGTLSSGVSIILSGAGTSTNAINTLNTTGLHQLSGSVILTNLSGSTTTLNAADLTYLSGGITGITSGTINATFTGGPGSGSGFIAGNVVLQTPTSGTVINCNFGTLSTIGQFVRLESSGDVTFTATGLTTTSGFFVTGYGSGVINSTTDLERVTGNIVLDHLGSGTINFTSSGAGASTGVVLSGVFITGRTNACTISGNLNSIQTISGNFILSSSGNVNLAATGLKEVSGFMLISGLGTGIINATTFNELSGINATGITGAGGAVPIFSISGNSMTGTLSLTGLKRISSITGQVSCVFSHINSTGITNLNTPSLTGLHSMVRIVLPNATGVTLTGLNTLGATGTGIGAGGPDGFSSGFQFEFGTGLTGDLNLSGLQYIFGVSTRNTSPSFSAGLSIVGSGLTSVSMPNIITGVFATGAITNSGVTATGIIRGASITGLQFGSSGTTKKMHMNFTASGCPLNQASVDNILQMFASLDGTNGTSTYSGLTITLNGLCSAPSATGSGYRTTLTGAGRLCTVLVN